MQNLAIVITADDNYALPMTVTLHSALEHLRGDSRPCIYVLDGGISPEKKDRVRHVISQHGVEPQFCAPNSELLLSVPLSGFPVSTYFRLLTPEILPQDVSKAIFLDSDMIVLEDLSSLWVEDPGESVLMACQDSSQPYVSEAKIAGCPDVQYADGDEYFNVGVLVMNLDRWREENLGRRVIDFTRKWPEAIEFADQDGLNALAIGRWKRLDDRWNQLLFLSAPAGYGDVYDRGIVHYAGHRKPWHAGVFGPMVRVYRQYLRSSGWYSRAEWVRLSCSLALRNAYPGIRFAERSLRHKTRRWYGQRRTEADILEN